MREICGDPCSWLPRIMGRVKTSLVGLRSPFYHNFAPVNNKLWQALYGCFRDRPQVLIRFRIVLQLNVATDSSIPK